VAAVPSIGRAVRVEGTPAPEADATRSLYEAYANQIFRYCLHQLGSREEAEDAVQSTFLNAFRGIKRGVVPELESAWLFKIAHNVCLSRRRSTWRRGRIESPADFEVVEELTPAPSRRADELMGLQDVLGDMPENQRRAILLREWQGLSYREIAEELELSQAAVETLIFRARRSLAAGLEQPPERKRRLARGADLGNLLAGLKTMLLGGGAAVKVAATVAVVSAGTVVAAAPVTQPAHQSQPVRTRAPAPAASLPARTGAATAPAPRTGPAPVLPSAAAKRRTRLFAAVALPAPVEAPAVPSSPAPADTPPAAAVPSSPDPGAEAATGAPSSDARGKQTGRGTQPGYSNGRENGHRKPSAPAVSPNDVPAGTSAPGAATPPVPPPGGTEPAPPSSDSGAVLGPVAFAPGSDRGSGGGAGGSSGWGNGK